MVHGGYAKTFKDAVLKYLDKKSLNSAYIPTSEKYLKSPMKIIEMILMHGGIPVIAHPCTINNNEKATKIIENLLIPSGLKGVEVIHPNMTFESQKYWKKIARKNNLFFLGGSDFHGNNCRGGSRLGIGLKNVDVSYHFYMRGVLGIKQIPIIEDDMDVTKLSLEEKERFPENAISSAYRV